MKWSFNIILNRVSSQCKEANKSDRCVCVDRHWALSLQNGSVVPRKRNKCPESNKGSRSHKIRVIYPDNLKTHFEVILIKMTIIIRYLGKMSCHLKYLTSFFYGIHRKGHKKRILLVYKLFACICMKNCQ